MNRAERRGQYSVPSRSKPYNKPRNPKAKNAAVLRGHQKIMRLLDRGIKHNQTYTVIKRNAVTHAVKRAMHSMRN